MLTGTHKDAKVIVIMDISMRGHMHDLRAVARRGWSDWMAFGPSMSEPNASPPQEEDGGGLGPYGERPCAAAQRAMMAVAIPLGRMVQQGEPIHWHKPTRLHVPPVGQGCCRTHRPRDLQGLPAVRCLRATVRLPARWMAGARRLNWLGWRADAASRRRKATAHLQSPLLAVS